MKATQIKNPVWLGQIAPRIEKFVRKLGVESMTYETLYAYLSNSIQYGGGGSEFWVVFNNATPIAAMHFFVRGLPYRGVVCCDFVYSWTNHKGAFQLLADEYMEFGKKMRCPYYEGYAIDERVFRIVNKAFKDRGYDLNNTGMINFLGRKNESLPKD